MNNGRIKQRSISCIQNHVMIVELNLFESKLYLTIIPDESIDKNEWSNTKQMLYKNITKSKDVKYKFAVTIRIPNDSIQLKACCIKSVSNYKH